MEEETETWLPLFAITRNAVAFLRSRQAGNSGISKGTAPADTGLASAPAGALITSGQGSDGGDSDGASKPTLLRAPTLPRVEPPDAVPSETEILERLSSPVKQSVQSNEPSPKSYLAALEQRAQRG